MNLKEEIKSAKEEIGVIKEKSFAFSVLEIYKNANRRLFIALMVTMCMWFITILLSVYVNKIGIENIVNAQDNAIKEIINK